MANHAKFSVAGKVAIVTGGGSGIGFEFVKLLVSKGCSVVIGDLCLRPESQELLNSNSTKPKVLFHKTDVTDWSSLQSLFSKTVSEFGTFDILCPSAGVFEPHWSNFWHPPGSAASKDPTSGFGHYAVLDINLTHPIRATQLALAEFLTPSDGSPRASLTTPKRIVHVASVAGEKSSFAFPMYVASKHAVVGFVRSLAGLDEQYGVRVTAVAPGAVRTPLWTDHPEKLRFVREGHDWVDWVTPQEVADAMLRLLEDDGVDGGTILEVGHENTRVVPELGNTGPTGRGFKISAGGDSSVEVHEWLKQEGWGKM